MRAIIQRVSEASVTIDKKETRSIDRGALVFLAVSADDTQDDIDWLWNKIVNMRIFCDPAGKMNESLIDQGGSLLIVSQFTLFASTKKGNRPSFSNSAPPEIAIPLYERFIQKGREAPRLTVRTGEFGAHMDVRLCNDGPVTIFIDSKNKE